MESYVNIIRGDKNMNDIVKKESQLLQSVENALKIIDLLSENGQISCLNHIFPSHFYIKKQRICCSKYIYGKI